jgi:hypothetical protein
LRVRCGAGFPLMDDDDWRWTPEVDPLIPTVDEPCEPQEIGRLYAPDGSSAAADRTPIVRLYPNLIPWWVRPNAPGGHRMTEPTPPVEPEVPETPPADPKPEALTPEQLRAALDEARRDAAKHRTRNKELEPLAKKAQELEDAQKSEAQRLTDQLAAAQKERDDARRKRCGCGSP